MTAKQEAREAIMARIFKMVPEIIHFDDDNRQYMPNEEGEFESFNTPAVFFKWKTMEWQSLGNRVQAADATFTLVLVCQVIQDLSSQESPKVRELGYKHQELEDRLNQALVGFNGRLFNSISRVMNESDITGDELSAWPQEFKTRLTDRSAARKYIKKLATLVIEINT